MVARAQPCPCSSTTIFSHPRNPKNRVQILLFPRPCSLIRRRLCAHATRRSTRQSRPWDSNAESVRAKRFNFSPQDEEDDEDYELGFSEISDEAIDSSWILKVFKSFGWLLPVILFSSLLTTGPKAFLMALALPLGQSAMSLVLKKLSGLGESKRKRRRTRKRSAGRSATASREAEREEEVKGGWESRRETKRHRSWVPDEDGSGPVCEGEQYGSSYGGWEDLDGMESGRKSSQMPGSSKRTTVGRKKLRMEVGRRNEPLLLRLLIAFFPFLGSWTRLFW